MNTVTTTASSHLSKGETVLYGHTSAEVCQTGAFHLWKGETRQVSVYLISLARAQERRENMRARLNKLGADYEVVDAVDGATLNPAEYETRLRRDTFRQKFGRDMTAGEIGCYLSHCQLWERLTRAENECALVLEDDAVFADDFADVVTGVVNCKWQWDVINLSHGHAHKHDCVLCELGNGRKLVRHRNYPGMLAAAYLIRPSGARKLLKHCRIMSEPLDVAYVQYWRHGAAFYHVDPSPVSQDETPTQVQGGAKAKLTLGDYAAHKLAHKRERWARNWYRWTHRPQKRKDAAQ